jgi:murein DD-endopeptidase MepM/ murein hydrolase activator NlpD
MKQWLAGLASLCLLSCGSIPRVAQGGADMREPVYLLPFSPGKKVWVVQGYNSWFSHKNTLGIDFKVARGTLVCAAREGVVIATKKDSDRHGLTPAYLAEGNYVFIRHEDGSVAQYWHFEKDGVMVSEGEQVQTGQAIGRSGHTGYSAFPHLHFEVTGTPTLFFTRQGLVYLRPGRFYRNW